jgi:hypothetical protein
MINTQPNMPEQGQIMERVGLSWHSRAATSRSVLIILVSL